MEVFLAKQAGFCEGVERAYRIALEQTRSGQQVFMLGNLVHNRQVIEKFKNADVITVKSVSEIPQATKGILLISAHGVPPEIYQEAKAKGLGVVDTTCPWVKKAQKIAQEFAKEGRTVVIVGDQGHTEVKGLLGWSNGKGKVIENAEDIKNITGNKIGVLAQTTQSKAHFQQIVSALKQKFENVKAQDTICSATSKRQEAAVDLARQVNLMLVIGDTMSANTKRLTELCSQTGTETHQIQTVSELEKSWLAGKAKVGLTSGASTPNWVIQKVINSLKNQA
ncbi:4-hydroxy-3-methylbut-2-enyl diphosphate reductase [Candidatus Saganbacteria bacterium CG08_land_8_20_14_0_20_45_16]|uniref:4-hydroxy-3-methylbut-2-enyl diphosphate reductase n=1 Tax=Candidatus Saganbacteria bacterium CG08_land_8_20_14_0_20_45_16 TaxID=2014293 RepID=A0A2H0Y3Z2_UNCSA|nr:MAG: 4-hydroxy-3-methylbut-2-enyl diphosphate reductase [Candidatus Saganbacteria bacterium CG08_land_8_20_14_0_20_45_16]